MRLVINNLIRMLILISQLSLSIVTRQKMVSCPKLLKDILKINLKLYIIMIFCDEVILNRMA